MSVKPRVTQFLTSVSVAALIIAAPYSAKVDGLGRSAIVTAAAFAQAAPDPSSPPGGVTGPDVGPNVPPSGPIDPPTGPIDPPIGPIDPPGGPIDPPGGPIDPPVGPVVPADPKPELIPAVLNHRNDDPVVQPETQPVAPEVITQAKATEFAQDLTCYAACTATVKPNGNITVDLTSNSKNGIPVETTVVQTGRTVEVIVSVNIDGETVSDTGQNTLPNPSIAQKFMQEVVANVPSALPQVIVETNHTLGEPANANVDQPYIGNDTIIGGGGDGTVVGSNFGNSDYSVTITADHRALVARFLASSS